MAANALTGYPKGWFVVSFSDELGVGEVKALRYFGRELVLFRGEDGVAHLLDAHCSHLGAHLAVGGKVVDCTIRCPFHAWRYDGEGACVEIPYAKRIPPLAKQRAWRTREVNGVILMHHDADGAEPEFDVPTIAEYGSDDWLPWTRNLYRIKTHPREIVENLADKGHFPAVHKTAIDDFGFSVDGFTATQRVKGRAFLANGGIDEFSSTTTYHGPGYLLMRMDGALQNYMLVAHTPIDEGTLDLRMGVMLKIVGDRARTEGYVAGYMSNLKAGFEDDVRVWENKVYRDRPLLCDGDGPIAQLRKWYAQFYAKPAVESQVR